MLTVSNDKIKQTKTLYFYCQVEKRKQTSHYPLAMCIETQKLSTLSILCVCLVRELHTIWSENNTFLFPNSDFQLDICKLVRERTHILFTIVQHWLLYVKFDLFSIDGRKTHF